ncbi:flagellin N-terminal helical domain-containing protein [Trinickia mobilis]|uniref:flagellin N-terminal helical domain-containing protein n=1 Tax=Trinickia mobilis TaxID=2816356 RepID=UPI001A900813|nr:flagellin [Trinickia mobilis]
MLSLHTNMASLMVQSAVSRTQSDVTKSMIRLGTGYRINTAADDAAGLQIATRLRAQTSGMAVAASNTQNATSLMQTANGAFDEIKNVLMRMKDLATQAADDSSSAADKVAMQAEYDALGEQLKNVMSNTAYGGEKLFSEGVDDGSGNIVGAGKFSKALTFQVGASSSETMTVDFSVSLEAVAVAFRAASAAFGGDDGSDGGDGDGGDGGDGGGNGGGSFRAALAAPGTELTDDGSANQMIDKLNDAIDKVGALSSDIGAQQNRLSSIAANLSNMSTNTTDATGRIMDVDYASETANSSSKQILMQAGTSMLKQSTQINQMVLSLLQ